MKLIRRDYEAAGGTEIFLSFEDSELDILFGFIRLRKPSDKAHRPEIKNDTFLIRELRVYGPVVEIGEHDDDAWQHLGLGENMISAAEEIGKTDFDASHLLVNSGIGVKEYYRNLGFIDSGPYLARRIG